jgi:hypothetical protein
VKIIHKRLNDAPCSQRFRETHLHPRICPASNRPNVGGEWKFNETTEMKNNKGIRANKIYNKKEIMSEQQNIDNQLVEWRKKFNKEIPERVGLAFYTNEKGETEVEVYFADDNMWMSQQIMSNLFDVEEHTITYHIAEVFKSGELEENATTRKIRVVRTEGKIQMNYQYIK